MAGLDRVRMEKCPFCEGGGKVELWRCGIMSIRWLQQYAVVCLRCHNRVMRIGLIRTIRAWNRMCRRQRRKIGVKKGGTASCQPRN